MNYNKTITMCIIMSIVLIMPINLSANPGFPGIDLPRVEQFTTGNGLKAYYIRDEIPMMTLTAAVGFGSLYEIKANAGLSSLLLKAISISGSKKHPGNDLYRLLENLGGRISFDSSWEQSFITITILDRHAETAFDILSSLIIAPRFGEKEINTARELIVESLKRQRVEPHILAFEKLREILYDGDGYGAVTTEETLRSLGSAALERTAAGHFTAKNMLLGITSSIDSGRIKELTGKYFGTLPGGEPVQYIVNTEKLLSSLSEKSNRIYLIPMEIPQATIAVGTIAPGIQSEDAYPLTVMNFILGGGSFNSRLMNEIRAKRGLSYSTASVMRFRKETGLFLAYAQTRSEHSPLTLKLLGENITLMKETPVSEGEISWTRSAMANSYIFEFDTPQNILGKYLFLDYNGLKDEYLKNHIAAINAVTDREILNSSRSLLKYGVVRVVVGSEKIAGKLEEFGRVTILR